MRILYSVIIFSLIFACSYFYLYYYDLSLSVFTDAGINKHKLIWLFAIFFPLASLGYAINKMTAKSSSQDLKINSTSHHHD